MPKSDEIRQRVRPAAQIALVVYLLLLAIFGAATQLGQHAPNALVSPSLSEASGSETQASMDVHDTAAPDATLAEARRAAAPFEPLDSAPAPQIVGRILGPAGAALAGVHVSTDASPSAQTQSLPSGRFELGGLDAGSVAVAICAEGYAETTLYTYLQSESDAIDLGEISLVACCSIGLSIVDESMRPVAGAQVWFAGGPPRISGWGDDGGYTAVGESDADGKFLLEELELATNRIRVTAQDFVRWSGTLESHRLIGVEQRVILEAGLFIEGQVLFSDIQQGPGHAVRCKSAAGTTIKAPLGADVVTSKCDPDGAFRLGPFPQLHRGSRFELFVACAGGYSEELKQPVTAAPGESGITLALKEGAYVQVHMTAEVAELAGPLESAELELWSTDGQYGYHGTVLPSVRVGPGADLTFQIPTGLEKEVDYRLDLRFERDVGFYSGLFRPVAGETQDLGVMQAQPGDMLQLTILDEETGEPVAGVHAELYPVLATDVPFTNHVRRARPAAGGSYCFVASKDTSSEEGVVQLFLGTDEKAELLIHGDGWVPVLMPLEARPEPVRSIDLSRGSTACIRILEGGEPTNRRGLRLIDLTSDYPQARLKQCRGDLRYQGANPGGYVVFEGLPRGSYRFKVSGSPRREVTVEVDGAGSVYQEIHY